MRSLTPSAGQDAPAAAAVESTMGASHQQGHGLGLSIGPGGQVPSVVGQTPGQEAVMPQMGAVPAHTSVAAGGRSMGQPGSDFGGMMSAHGAKDPSVLNSIESGAPKDQVLGEANRVLGKAQADPAWGQSHKNEVDVSNNLVRQHEQEMQRIDPERGLRQQMTQGGPGREPGRDLAAGGPEQGAPKPGMAPANGQPDASKPASTLDKVKDFVTEHPMATAAIVAVAAYALQSAFSSGGGSILGAGKWGLLAGGAAMIGGKFLGGDKDKEKKDEGLGIMDAINPISLVAKLGKMAYSKLGPSGAGQDSSASSGAGTSASAPAPSASGADIKPMAGPGGITKTI